jgi:hypothetical protein
LGNEGGDTMTDKETLKLALDDLIAEYHMETSSFAKRVDEIFKQALAAPVQDTEAHYKGIVEGVQKLFDDKRAQPAVPDAFGTREGEHPQYIQGWNDCRAEMLRGKP